MDRVTALRKLSERMAAAAGKRIAVTSESANLVSQALQAYADLLSRPSATHHVYSIDVWDEEDRLVEPMAGASNLMVARAAYDQAVKERGTYRVTLRKGIMMVADYRGRRTPIGALRHSNAQSRIKLAPCR